MVMTFSVQDYCVLLLLVTYLLTLGFFVRQQSRNKGAGWLLAALLCWPLFMIDEWIRIAGFNELAVLYGLSDIFAAVTITCCYRAIKPMLYLQPSAKKRLWLPVGITALLQLTVFLIPTAEKQAWLLASPIGDPLVLWPAYAAPLVTGFSVLLIGILITEHMQTYHRHLPEQAVDISEFKIKSLTSVMGITVGVAFMSILLVTAATFGFFQLAAWESYYHLMLGAALLSVLASMLFARNTSPSPFDYERLDEGKATPYEISSIISKAERHTIDSKAYKARGLTIGDFCEAAGLDPTSLAIALRVSDKKNFRRFIFHFRLEYAKKVLLQTDTKVAAVAKRLGLNSEKFLSDYLVKHLTKNASGK
jgi:AraC-like DNA-binding protein